MLGVDPGIGGDLKVILLVTFVDGAKKNFCDERTNERISDIGHLTPYGQTGVSVEIVM